MRLLLHFNYLRNLVLVLHLFTRIRISFVYNLVGIVTSVNSLLFRRYLF